ncbi:MAG: FAD-linked oxidase C-terminal domain-containing protein [bacterium]
MDRKTIKACEKFLKRELPFNEAEAHLWIGLDGNRKEEVEPIYQTIGEICLENGALDVLVAEDRPNRDKIWQTRQSIREALVKVSSTMSDEDVVVPRSKILLLLKGVNEISGRYSLSIAKFGHLGDGNIHLNILKEDVDNAQWKISESRTVKEIFDLVLSLGGLISGEHGIGLAKKKYLDLAVDAAQIKVMKGIKRVFDPNNILNPGKIFDL